MITRTPWLFACLVAASALAQAQATSVNLAPLPMPAPKGTLTSMPLGQAPANQVLHLAVGLTYGDPAGMQRFVDSVSDPKSAEYRHFLTPAQIGARFGLPMSTVNRVANYLTSQGMKITLMSPSRIEILVDATVAQAESAFHTSIENFVTLASSDRQPASFFAYTSEPMAPSMIAPYIVHVGGMENFTRPRPRTTYPNDSPTQLRTLYSLAPMYSGGVAGQNRTVGISSFDGFRLSNVDAEYTAYSLPTPPGGVEKNITVKLSANSGGGAGSGTEGGEADLDIQATLGMAPLCSLIIYDGGDGDLEGVLTLEQTDNTCDVITESYGWDLDLPTGLACHDLHLAMSAQGITYMCASGDDGTDLGDGGAIYPDQDPEVLMVGGTTANVNTAGNRISEPCWSDNGASGGGWWPTSDTFNVLPPYQTQLLGNPNGVPSNINYRLVPDVALNADPNTGYDVNNALQGGWTVIGGTSGASPTFAGSLADTEQKIIAGGGLPADAKGNRRFGRIMDLLYSYKGDPTVFYDVTTGGTTGNLPNGAAALPGVGWDFTTGWGAMIFSGFAAKVLSVPAVKLTKLTVSPATLEGGSATTVTGTATIASAAPAGGASISLASSSTSVSVPATLTIPAGQTSAQFTLTTHAVAATTTVTITGKTSTSVATASVSLTAPHVSALALSATSTLGGSTPSVTGTVTIAEGAPTGGLVVTLSSDTTAAATVPGTVTVAAGAKTATFTITSHAVAKTATVHISAVTTGASVSAVLTVSSASVTGVTLSASSAYGGNSVTGTIMLSGLAPSGGAAVTLALSSTTSATLSATSATVPAGAKSTTFSIKTKPVSASASVTVTASLGGSAAANLTILPPVLSTMGVGTTTLLGGVNNVTVSATLISPAGPGGAVVTIGATPATAAKFAATTMTIPAGATSSTAVLTTLPVSTNTTVVISGAFGGTKTVDVTVDAATLTAVTVSPTSVKGGSSTVVTGKVTLNGPAGPSARSVTLTSSNANAAQVPATVSIPAGATSATFAVTTKVVAATTTVTLTATLATGSHTATLTVTH